MSNGARHAIGVLIGLIVTPLVAAALMYGTQKLGMSVRVSIANYRSEGGSDKWVGAALLIAAAAALGVSAGSRLSPLASLVPGLAFASVGALWVLAPSWAAEHTLRDSLPDRLAMGYLTLAPYGGFLIIGTLLIAASLAPSRWAARSTAGAAARFGGPPPAPMGPPPARPMSAPMGNQMAPPPPLGAPPAPGHAAPPGRLAQDPAPWQSPSGPYGHPAPGASGAPGNSPSPFAPPPVQPPQSQPPKPSSSQEGSGEGVGEWTQMYGGDDLRGEGRDRPS